MFFIPAGKIHAIGAGVLLAEIQQTSDITYRVYDFDRKDKNGNTENYIQNLPWTLLILSRKMISQVLCQGGNTVNPAVVSPYFTTDY